MAVLGSLAIAAATGCGQAAKPFTARSYGTVVVNDPRGDAGSPQVDILRGRLTLADGRFVARIVTVEPITSGYGASTTAGVFVTAGGQDWSILADWTPAFDESGELLRAATSCEAVKGVDFMHARPCRVAFRGRGVTLRFSASFLRDDGHPIRVRFETERPHDIDVAPGRRSGAAALVVAG